MALKWTRPRGSGRSMPVNTGKDYRVLPHGKPNQNYNRKHQPLPACSSTGESQ